MPKVKPKQNSDKVQSRIVRKFYFWHVRPKKTQISLCILWSEFCICGYPKCAHWRFWSVWVRRAGWSESSITKTRLFKCIENFTTKNWKFSGKNSDIFHISAENIDCGYTLEPPRRGGSNEYPQSMYLSRNKKKMYTPVNPSSTV